MKRFLLASSSSVYKQMPPAGIAIPSILFFPQLQFAWIRNFFLALAILAASIATAQTTTGQQDDYKKVVTERAVKIINTLEITDSVQYRKVLASVVDQYIRLNRIHDTDKTAVEAIKQQFSLNEEMAAAQKKQEEKKSAQLLQLHRRFIALLKEQLTEGQIEKIKDGMTYRVLPITWAAYQDMLPQLTTEQKSKIYNWLIEARELAMDEGSSEKKHAVFGKFKGRINNYLSAAGYDMKKEGQAWRQRIKEREAAKKEANNR